MTDPDMVKDLTQQYVDCWVEDGLAIVDADGTVSFARNADLSLVKEAGDYQYFEAVRKQAEMTKKYTEVKLKGLEIALSHYEAVRSGLKEGSSKYDEASQVIDSIYEDKWAMQDLQNALRNEYINKL